MNKVMKWIAVFFVGLMALGVLAGAGLYSNGMRKLSHSYPDIPVETIQLPTNAEAIARGKHVSVIWACTHCHGPDLSGKLLESDPVSGLIPTLGTLSAANLTSGKGGIGQAYTDMDWIRVLRHGVKPDGKATLFMDFSTMSNQDLGDLLAYLKQIPPVDKAYPAIDYGPVIPIFPGAGIFVPAAGLIDHNASLPAGPTPGATVEYGRYLSAICTGCHVNGAGASVQNWQQDDFIQTFNTGILPNGRDFGPTMSSETFSELTDMELEALWLYFTSGNP